MQRFSFNKSSLRDSDSLLWLGVRIVVLLVGLLQSPFFAKSLRGDFSKPSWTFALEMVFFVCLGIFLIIFIQSSNSRSSPVWIKPSWFVNPLNYKQPIQIFHMGAFYFLAVGAGCFFLGVYRTEISWLWELPASVGFGMWLGVKISTKIFRSKFNPD